MKTVNQIESIEKMSGGRVAIVRSVSMQPEDWNYVHARVSELRPRVKDRSHYFQLLVRLEQAGDLDLLANINSAEAPREFAERLTRRVVDRKQANQRRRTS